jgi:hypothetical protein
LRTIVARESGGSRCPTLLNRVKQALQSLSVDRTNGYRFHRLQCRHIVRSAPDSNVLIVSVELCTLRLQESENIERPLSFLLFADGGAAVWSVSIGPGLTAETMLFSAAA